MLPSQLEDRTGESFRRLFLRLPATEDLPDDAPSFDAEIFAATLKRSHVKAVTFLACGPVGAGGDASYDKDWRNRLVAACRNEGLKVEEAVSTGKETGVALTSFPSRPALEVACYHRLCRGLPLLLEDTLSPTGTFDAEAYRLLGTVYDEIAFKERWWRGARRLVEIGILSPQHPTDSGSGAARIAQAGGHDYDLLDVNADFTPYRLLILPEDIPCTSDLKARVQTYLEQGGSLLAAFENSHDAQQSSYGVTGETSVLPGYGLISPGSGEVTLLGEPHFRSYAQSAGTRHKRTVLEALKRLLPDPLLRHDGAGTLETILTEQVAHNRWSLHLMHYLPLGFALDSPVRDEIVPLHEVKFSLKTSKPVARVTLRPQHHDELDFWEHQGRVEFVVPRIAGHRIVSIEFES